MTTRSLSALNHRIPPPILTVFTALLMWGLAQATPRWPLPDGLRLLGSGALLLVGLAFLASGFLAFRAAKTTINPVNIEAASSLVTSGVFRVSRNPMYVGFTAVLAAWTVYLAAPCAVTGVLGFMLFIYRFQILPEEQVMHAKFGAEFETYRRSVRRWL